LTPGGAFVVQHGKREKEAAIGTKILKKKKKSFFFIVKFFSRLYTFGSCYKTFGKL